MTNGERPSEYDAGFSRMTYLIYLGICNARGWIPSEEGLKAFLRQQQTGWRDGTGRMIWPK